MKSVLRSVPEPERSGAEHKAFLAPAGALERSLKNFSSGWSGAERSPRVAGAAGAVF